MAWLESHQSLGRHPKLLRLAAELRVNKAQALGHLQYLWWWALDYSPTGDLSAFAPAEISAAAEWTGEPEKFSEILKKTGWIDESGNIHDWMDYAGHYILSRRRQKRYRKKALALRNGDVTNASTVPNITIPNITNKTEQRKAGPLLELPEDLEADRETVGAWLAYKRERGQPYKPRGLAALWSRLRAIPAGQRAAAVQESMANNWQGIFPPKSPPAPPGPPAKEVPYLPKYEPKKEVTNAGAS